MSLIAGIHPYGQKRYRAGIFGQAAAPAKGFFPATYSRFLMLQLNDPNVLVTKLSPPFDTPVSVLAIKLLKWFTDAFHTR